MQAPAGLISTLPKALYAHQNIEESGSRGPQRCPEALSIYYHVRQCPRVHFRRADACIRCLLATGGWARYTARRCKLSPWRQRSSHQWQGYLFRIMAPSHAPLSWQIHKSNHPEAVMPASAAH